MQFVSHTNKKKFEITLGGRRSTIGEFSKEVKVKIHRSNYSYARVILKGETLGGRGTHSRREMSENEQSARRRKRPWRQPRQPVGGGSGLVMAGREVSQAVAEGEGGAKEKGCASEGDAMTRRMDEGREAEEGMGEGDTGKNGTDEGDASSSVGGAQASNSVRAEGQKGKEKARVVKGKKRKARSSLEGQGDGGRRERSELQNELQTNGGLEVGVASADVVEIDGSVMEGVSGGSAVYKQLQLPFIPVIL